jgi:hypothetical protein
MDKVRPVLSRTPEWRRARKEELKKINKLVAEIQVLLAKLRKDTKHNYRDIIHFKSRLDS